MTDIRIYIVKKKSSGESNLWVCYLWLLKFWTIFTLITSYFFWLEME